MPLPIFSHFQDFPVSGYRNGKGGVQGKGNKKSSIKERVIPSAAFEALMLL